MKFSERMGYSEILGQLPEHDMPDSLRNGLWDACCSHFFYDISASSSYGAPPKSVQFSSLCKNIWFNFYKFPTDEIPESAGGAYDTIRVRFFEMKIFELYNFLEFLSNVFRSVPSGSPYNLKEFTESCNRIFEREKCAFRFAEFQLIKVSSEVERQEIENALCQDISVGVREHIAAAAKHYSRRESPDYRNSIKESISAVESAVSHVLGKKSAGVKPLQSVSEELGLHPALTKGFINLYGYTSDAGGIRHALMDESEITQEDAHYMLVSCAAFANYLLKLKSKS